MATPRTAAQQGVSVREAEVLAAIGDHLTNAEISARLVISVRTVESHVSSLLRKLQVEDRRALAAVAASTPGPSGGPNAQRPLAPLPSPLTPFVGRTVERARLAEALRAHRLVTAVGPGGVGKTRLALSVAADLTDGFADGVWYVDLVPVTDPAMIAPAIADALGLGEPQGRPTTDHVLGWRRPPPGAGPDARARTAPAGGATRRQHGHPRAPAEETLDERRHAVAYVLTVVEHDERPAVGQHDQHRLVRATTRLLTDAETRRHSCPHHGRLGDRPGRRATPRRRTPPPAPTPPEGRGASGDPARPHRRDLPVLPDRQLEVRALRHPSDERRQRRGQRYGVPVPIPVVVSVVTTDA